VANLVNAGAVEIDQAGADVVKMSAEEYMVALDQLYGIDRV
jgi:hypothetical protein